MSASPYTTRLEPFSLGAQKELFLDDDHVNSLTRLTRCMGEVERMGPILEPDSDAGEVAMQTRSSPIWNPEREIWQWWYWGNWACEPYGRWHTEQMPLTHLAESVDGIHWTKPNIGLYEWHGSRHNNIVMDPELGARALYHILRDEREPDPAKRYKAMMGQHGRKPFASPDGLTWTELPTEQIASSDESHLFYDEQSERFVALVKRGTVWGRSVFLATSKDFVNWDEHGIVMHADAQDWDNRWSRISRVLQDDKYLSPPLVDEENHMAETYQMAAMPYEGMYVGFVGLFNPAGAIPPPHMNHTGLNQTELACSRDLKRWRRLCDRQVFLGVQPWDGVNYDCQQVLLCGRPVVRDDAIWIYYNAARFRGHKELFDEKYHPWFKAISTMCLAKLRLDGFVSIDAGGDRGELMTKRLRFEGDRLSLNVNAAGGRIRVEVIDDASDTPIDGLTLAECQPVDVDDLQAIVRWEGGESVRSRIGDRPVRLRFVMEQASLFSYCAV